MNNVIAYKCENYDQNVQERIDRILEHFGGMQKLIKPNDLVVLKVNLVCGASPDKMCTTHPTVVKGIARRVVEAGGVCVIADSPGGPYTANHLKSVYKKTEMQDICDEIDGVTLNQDFGFSSVQNEQNLVCKSFEMIDILQKADAIINLSKCKTHTYMGYSGPVKNMFGAIPGLVKVQMHGNFVDQNSFADMLIDINQTLKHKVVLNVLDAIVGMEGQGPTGGTPKQIGLIMASDDVYALDLAQAKLISEQVQDFPLVERMKARNLIAEDLEVRFEGDAFATAPMQKVEFDVPKIEVYTLFRKYIPPFLIPLFHKMMTKRPIVKKRNCRGCSKCQAHCPKQAITMIKTKKGKTYAKVDYTKCIRCFCCQELCPFQVVKIKSGVLHKVLRFTRKNAKKDKKEDRKKC